jgi:hypothetical protein
LRLPPRLPLLLLLLAPGRRSPGRTAGSIIRREVHLLPAVVVWTQPPLRPLPRQQLRLLLLAVLLQEVAQVCVARAACCGDELLRCPACLLEPPQGE